MYFRSDETIIAPATVPGTGAISILRVSGPDALPATDRVVRFAKGSAMTSKGYSLHYGRVTDKGEFLDDVLVSVFRAPHSYTGEDAVEITCHASAYIVSEILRLFLEAGVRMAEPGEFTQRAFLAGKMDLAQAEAVADVIASSTRAAHRVAVSQLKGGFSRELQEIRDQLLEMTSLLELELDFSEEDVEFADRSRLRDLIDKAIAHTGTLADSFRAGNALKNGIPVAIVGPVNAGKSTLLNALLGEDRALVSNVPGTTRDTIEDVLDLGGIAFRFIDTAGIRETSEQVESMGIARSYQAATKADIVLFVLDASCDVPVLQAVFDDFLSRVDFSGKRLFLLWNKADLIGLDGVNKNVIDYNKIVLPPNIERLDILISGKTKEGLSELKSALSDYGKRLDPEGNSTLVTNVRHYEALRETTAALSSARTSLSRSLPSDLVAEDLRSALHHLSSITGSSVTPDDILGNIFSKFCIGK